MHPQQLAALHRRGFEMRQAIEQAGGVQPVFDGAQPLGTLRMPVAHGVQEKAGVGDVGGGHGAGKGSNK